jgi:hypothetical protein
MRREVESLRPPIFHKHFLSGVDSRRVLRFRAQSGLRCQGNRMGSVAPFLNDL